MGKRVKDPPAKPNIASLPDYPRGLTFEHVWAALMEDRVKREIDYKEMRERSDRLDKQISALGNRFGEMIEHMMRPKIREKLKSYGFLFTETSFDKEFGTDDNIIAEVDVFLENREKVMVVEIKSKPDMDDVKDHLERMDILRAWADDKDDKRQYFGTIGGMVFDKDVQKFAHKCGLYTIIPSGDAFDIVEPAGEYRPRVW